MAKTIEDLEIAQYPVPIIDQNGNVGYTEYAKYCLQDKNGKRFSGFYYSMEALDEDHYIVSNMVVVPKMTNPISYGWGIKQGIIHLEKDKNGDIVPMEETLVVPEVYDRIISGNSQIIIGEVQNKRFTYIELNPKSENYGKQLVPAILEQAVPFDVNYKDFAECTVAGVNGYIPRTCQPRRQLNSSDLITKENMKLLALYSKFLANPAYESSMEQLSRLTGKNQPSPGIQFVKK